MRTIIMKFIVGGRNRLGAFFLFALFLSLSLCLYFTFFASISVSTQIDHQLLWCQAYCYRLTMELNQNNCALIALSLLLMIPFRIFAANCVRHRDDGHCIKLFETGFEIWDSVSFADISSSFFFWVVTQTNSFIAVSFARNCVAK